MSAYRLACIVAAAVALATWVWALSPVAADAELDEIAAGASGPPRSSETPRASAPPPTHAPPPTPPNAPPPTHASGARSLIGTDVDGALSRDADGRFVPDREAIRLFDYFLSAEGEQDAAMIRAHLTAAARARLGYDEAERALALYDRYLAYRATLQSAFAAATPTGDLSQALLLAERAQVDVFGAADAERLFATDNAAAAAVFARARR